jgi:hypothetical protein
MFVIHTGGAPAPSLFVHFLFQRRSTVTKTAYLLAFIVTALVTIPAHAQRVFVSWHGLDTNPCTEIQPCRTFQQAYNTAAADWEINVLDPAGYGPLTITHGISIPAHGWDSIVQTQSCPTCAAITISASNTDTVSLNGLVLDGEGSGLNGIYITSGAVVTILNSVVRHFRNPTGLGGGIGINDSRTSLPAIMLIEDTIASDNNLGISIGNGNAVGIITATLNRITTNNNNSAGVRDQR